MNKSMISFLTSSVRIQNPNNRSKTHDYLGCFVPVFLVYVCVVGGGGQEEAKIRQTLIKSCKKVHCQSDKRPHDSTL